MLTALTKELGSDRHSFGCLEAMTARPRLLIIQAEPYFFFGVSFLGGSLG